MIEARLRTRTLYGIGEPTPAPAPIFDTPSWLLGLGMGAVVGILIGGFGGLFLAHYRRR